MSSSTGGGQQQQQQQQQHPSSFSGLVAMPGTKTGYVSQQVMEYLITEILNYCEPKPIVPSEEQAAAAAAASSGAGGAAAGGGGGPSASSGSAAAAAAPPPGSSSAMLSSSEHQKNDEEARTVASEMAAAKLERMGYSIGYRITERLAQNKTWNTSVPNQDVTAAVAAQQLEAVKFLCKEIWIEIFTKQVDKLQTNHRGVFVLKDFDFTWLNKFPSGTEHARVLAIRLLAFPCGIIRGSLSNLGIPAVVSCDFLTDGQKMSSCSFNIKVK